MALANNYVPLCSFHWDILHPFTPWRILMARFSHASSIVTQWNVMIVPWARGINWWTFKLRLQIENFDGRGEIRADRVQVNIFLQNRFIHEHDVTNVSFWPRDAYAYTFTVDDIANDLQDEELLVVKVRLDIRAEPVYDNRYTLEDSSWLSADLLRLYRYPAYSDLRLRLPDRRYFSVHTCIFEARWNYFLILHESNANGEIEVNVSLKVLGDILKYLYSGQGQQFGWTFRGVNYITELFYVMNRYQMNHLERVLRIQNMQQRRVSVKDAKTVTLIFPLWELVNGRFVGSMQRFHVNETPYKFTFTIYVQTYCSSPWLSYSLTSSTGIYVHAKVNLYIRKIAATHGNDEQAYYQITHVHQCDYIIKPKGFAQSQNVLFLGCPATFENFTPVKSPAQILEGSHSMLCTLKFTDGRFIDLIQSTVDDFEVEQGEMNSLNLLGDHLFRLFSSQVEADLMINAPSENENQPDETYWIHRAIFAARVPRWWSVFQDYQGLGVVMPEETRLHLRSEALPFVLYYIYSSRSHYVSPDLFEHIKSFAETGLSFSLLNHIIRIRYEQEIGDSE